MSISTLSRFTVPLGSTETANAQGLLMPKLQYRFRVFLENFGVSKPTTEITKQVMDITRPVVTFDDIELPVYNSRVRLAGRPVWENITLTLRDDVSGEVQKLVGQQLQKQFDFFEQSSAASGIDYKFTTRIEVLDGGNGQDAANTGVFETWEVYGCYLQGANYNTLNYASSDPVTVTLTIRYDNAVQFKGASGSGVDRGVGAAIGRTVGQFVTGGGATG
jgi:hypothetical protein